MNLVISAFWEQLKTIQTLVIRCEKEDLWQGFANINVVLENEQTIIFHEKGEWEKQNISFTNTLRWTLHSDSISIEHLRFGLQTPVFLLYLTPTEHNCLDTISPHYCQRDTYSARAFWTQEAIHFFWNVQGPLKNYKIYSYYSKTT